MLPRESLTVKNFLDPSFSKVASRLKVGVCNALFAATSAAVSALRIFSERQIGFDVTVTTLYAVGFAAFYCSAIYFSVIWMEGAVASLPASVLRRAERSILVSRLLIAAAAVPLFLLPFMTTTGTQAFATVFLRVRVVTNKCFFRCAASRGEIRLGASPLRVCRSTHSLTGAWSRFPHWARDGPAVGESTDRTGRGKYHSSKKSGTAFDTVLNRECFLTL
jgi:hypothetical protein